MGPYGHYVFCAEGLIDNFISMKKFKRIFVLMTLVVMSLQLCVTRIASAYVVGDIVINEIAWAGSNDNSSDEWIELYNTSNSEIDLSGWMIEDDVVGSYSIEEGVISAHGYFLIEDIQDATSAVSDAVIGLSLANAGDSLVLKDGDGEVIDSVNSAGGAWYAGDGDSKASMERIDPQVSLDSAENWASATSSNGSVGRSGSEILGTPGSVNSNYGGSGPEVYMDSSFDGGQVVLDVYADNVVDLYAYGLEINYDSGVLDYASSSEGALLDIDGVDTAFNSALENGNEGVLILGNARLSNPAYGVDGSGILATVYFDILSNTNSTISFGGGSYLADSAQDITAAFSSLSLVLVEDSVGGVTNLDTVAGSDLYSIELNWDDVSADSYLVKKLMPDGSYFILGEVNEPNFLDENGIVTGVSYSYQVVVVVGGVEGLPSTVAGAEERGLKGDLDKSSRVDGRDIESLARSYGSEYGDEEYELGADTNYDGIIDGSDLINVGIDFGLSSL